MGVPNGDIIIGDDPAANTMGEAGMVKAFAGAMGYGSLIVVTSPTHTRRAQFIFEREMEGEGIRIQMHASPYSGFRPDDWWKTRRYAKEVIVEYEKLLFYWLQSF
jgi:uncharacterized SAM-binding protein YcdF (DUF218 family)